MSPTKLLFYNLVSRTLGQSDGAAPASVNHATTANTTNLSTGATVSLVIFVVLLLLSLSAGFWYFMCSARHKQTKTQDANLEDGLVKDERKQRWIEIRRDEEKAPWDSDVELVKGAAEIVVVPKDAHVKH